MTEELYVSSRDDWRAWLRKNHGSKKGVWLVYYKKYTGKPSIPYDDSVEEALCFGWVDSIIGRLMLKNIRENSHPERPRVNGLKQTRRESKK